VIENAGMADKMSSSHILMRVADVLEKSIVFMWEEKIGEGDEF